MEFNHKPVLLKECLEYLDIKPKGIYVDGTAGGAGHSAEIYKRLEYPGLLLGIDQDSYAIKTARDRLEAIKGQARFILENNNFVNIKEICLKNDIREVDGILLDLGVSSHQLDEGSRGFSYQKEAPLDMRMDTNRELNAETIVNEYTENEIREIIRNYGEEKWASRIAAFIVKARNENRIKTTLQLVDIIKAAIPSAARREGPHPAKRTFQAIRIAVNNELGILTQAIDDSVDMLKSGGRLCIITFHSLEDRIVKNEFARLEDPCTCPKDFPVCVCGKRPQTGNVTRKPVIPDGEELEENPRSRSAKLRVLKKL